MTVLLVIGHTVGGLTKNVKCNNRPRQRGYVTGAARGARKMGGFDSQAHCGKASDHNRLGRKDGRASMMLPWTAVSMDS